MPEKKPWTEEQDKILRHLFEIEKIPKWSKIAQTMADEYRMLGRNGKQCRERYQSVIQPTFVHLEWTQEQQKTMYLLHDKFGNKWAQIAQKMTGRSDNCVKNHFYSNLRKAIRKLNKVILQNFKSQIKQIRPIVLYKIIQATDEHFKLAPSVREEISLNCGKLKNRLLEFASDSCNFEEDLIILKELAVDIQNFQKDYKRKPKRDRRGVAQSLNLMKVPKIDKFKCASDAEESCSDISIQVSERDSIHIGEKVIQSQKKPGHKVREVIQVSKNSLCLNQADETCPNKGIQLVLKNAGVLEDVNYTMNPFCRQSIQSISELSDLQYKNERFNLGESIEKFKYSFVMRHSGDFDDQEKLFGSM